MKSILLPNISNPNQIVHDFVLCPPCNERFKKKGPVRHARYAHLYSEKTFAELE